MRGKICLVTGATSGIGYETALGLARAGAHIGIVGRDPARTQQSVRRIRAEVADATVDAFVADLSSQAEIRRLADDVRGRYPRLDVLVNNAGAIFDTRQVTVDGLERTWAFDHLGYVLLTLELLDLLKAGTPARIVNVASAAHMRGRIDFDDLEGVRRHWAEIGRQRNQDREARQFEPRGDRRDHPEARKRHRLGHRARPASGRDAANSARRGRLDRPRHRQHRDRAD